MRVWVDLTNSPHVLVMRPLIKAMRADGHEVEVTARDFAQTLELCERFGIEHTPIGRHRGERLIPKFAGLVARSAALARWAHGRGFELAMGHGSNDVNVAAALLRIPAATAFDYEFAAAQHHVNCRLCRVVVVPEAIPPFTTFEGRLGAVDEALVREGRLRRLTDPDQVDVERRAEHNGLRIRRDPRELVTLLLSATDA
jgi:predicted glycosyltransferase